jgi:hypothetical protein
MKELSLYWKQVHTVLDSIYVYSVTLNRVAQTLKSDKILTAPGICPMDIFITLQIAISVKI